MARLGSFSATRRTRSGAWLGRGMAGGEGIDIEQELQVAPMVVGRAASIPAGLDGKELD